MTTQQIITDSRKRLLELGAGVFIDDEIINWANLVLIKLSSEILDQARIVKTTLSFTNGIATLPTNYMSFYFAKDYDWVTIEDFENDIATNMICRKEGNIYIKPTTVTSLNIYYYKKPTELSLTALSAEPEIPAVAHECLVLGIMIRAFEAMQEQELATLYLNKYTALVNEAKQTISILEERNFKGKPFLSYQKLI